MSTLEYYYRYTDDILDASETYPNHGLEIYIVSGKTPCGVWITHSVYQDEKEHFVLNNSRKKFAYPDKKDAIVSFIARKSSQLRILAGQRDRAESALYKGQRMLEGIVTNEIHRTRHSATLQGS